MGLYRNTKQSALILNIINESSDHLTASMIYEKARCIIPNISLGTVYRNLNSLYDANKIRKVIQINFDNFNRYNDDRAVIKFEMRDEKGIKEGVSLESYHVILPNVKEKYYNENNKDDLIGKLVIFVAERDEELQKLIDKHIELRPVGKKLVEISREEEARGIYDLEEHERRVRNSLIEDALEDGWNRGKKEGKEEGIKEGIKENKLSVAKRMLEKNIDINVISECTGLSEKEIKTL